MDADEGDAAFFEFFFGGGEGFSEDGFDLLLWGFVKIFDESVSEFNFGEGVFFIFIGADGGEGIEDEGITDIPGLADFEEFGFDVDAESNIVGRNFLRFIDASGNMPQIAIAAGDIA